MSLLTQIKYLSICTLPIWNGNCFLIVCFTNSNRNLVGIEVLILSPLFLGDFYMIVVISISLWVYWHKLNVHLYAHFHCRRKWFLMPCPFTGPKMFCAGPNFLSQPKNLTAFSASSKTFVPAQQPILLNANHLFVWHKMFVTPTKCK